MTRNLDPRRRLNSKLATRLISASTSISWSGDSRRLMVGPARFELTTSCTPCKRSTRLNYGPTFGRARKREPESWMGLPDIATRIVFFVQAGHIFRKPLACPDGVGGVAGSRSCGAAALRAAQRACMAPSRAEPPRSTRLGSVSGLSALPGLFCAPGAYGASQSPHHSATLPDRSCKPATLGANLPTGAVKGGPRAPNTG